MKNIQTEDIWLNKKEYDDSETRYYENLSRATLTPLVEDVVKVRKKLIDSRDSFSNDISNIESFDAGAFKFVEKKVVEFEKAINQIINQLNALGLRLASVEAKIGSSTPVQVNTKSQDKVAPKEDEDDDVDLFASDSDEEESAEAARIREERLAAYAAKKSKKPALIAKSNIILDIKPWDDETDMKAMEKEVRKIECEGLLWGASKLVPLAYGIHKLQISSVVEDDKVSIDWLTEQIESIEDYVQSVDIAAFNKI